MQIVVYDFPVIKKLFAATLIDTIRPTLDELNQCRDSIGGSRANRLKRLASFLLDFRIRVGKVTDCPFNILRPTAVIAYTVVNGKFLKAFRVDARAHQRGSALAKAGASRCNPATLHANPLTR
jgi:hypothetical protein